MLYAPIEYHIFAGVISVPKRTFAVPKKKGLDGAIAPGFAFR
jgi:hypothetical protein